MRALVAGGGIFGVTAALALRARGHDGHARRSGPVPHPLAESTDISKVVRMDYGADEDYTALGERALDGLAAVERALAAPAVPRDRRDVPRRARRSRPAASSTRAAAMLARRGHAVERLDAAAIARALPRVPPRRARRRLLQPDRRLGRDAARGRAARRARRRARGVAIRAARVERLARRRRRASTASSLRADLVVVCAGSWVPLLAARARAGAARGRPARVSPRPADPRAVRGAPLPGVRRRHLAHRLLRLPGQRRRHRQDREPRHRPRACPRASERARGQRRARRPRCARCSPTRSRRSPARRSCTAGCASTATPPTSTSGSRADPARPGVVVATGGSGHAFKFAPVLGDLIATIALGEPHPLAAKLRWRPEIARGGAEAARFHG